VSTRTYRFLPLIFLPASKPGGSILRPLFSALDALAVDDGRRGTGLALGPLAAEHVKRVVQPLECAVVLPAAEAEIDGAARWQVLRDRPPLAASAQHIHQPVHHLAHVDGLLVTAALGSRNLPLRQRPFLIGQVAGVAQLAPVIPGAVLDGPNRAAPANRRSRNGITTDS
jgi:hypothetical protein